MNKKMIAPIIIGVLIVLYYLFVSIGFIVSTRSIAILIFVTIILCSIIFLVLKLVKERMDEIKSGEEDDFHKY